MKTSTLARRATIPVLLLGAAAQAQIPSSAPYYTDPQSLYVQDDTAQGIGNLNMVLCVIGGLDPGDMVNAGPYIALVDMNKCNNKGGGNGNAAGATNYATAVVNVTRADNNSPMIGKVWMSLTEQGGTTNVYAYLSATQSPSAAPPYGVFRMDYIGKKTVSGVTAVGFNGFIDSQPGTINYYEGGAQSNQTALSMTATSTGSGAGTMNIAANGGGSGGPATTFQFAYDSGYFRRSDGTNDQCFDRARANAAVSVWQYGTYDAATGARVDQANPGFPIQATYQGTSYYGFANYWGINFQGLDLNAIADASPILGMTVTDQRPNNTTAYAFNKIGGKFTQWTQNATTLAALDGIPFTFGADLTGLTTNTALVSGWNNWVAHWDTATLSFIVTGQQTCGSNGCLTTALTGNATATVLAAFVNTNPIQGWSDSFGGNINIPATGGTHAASDAVFYFTQSTVIPGSSGAPTALYCLSQCPTAISLAAFPAGNSTTTPFGNGTDTQWFSAPSSANTVTYSFGAGGLTESATAMILENTNQYPANSTFLQNGVQTGRLFTSPLSNANCPAGTPGGTVCEPQAPSTYYTWQTGTNQWSQSLWLTRASNGTVVAMDPPQNIHYTVPAGAAYGSWAGKAILLQFNGFGNLYGVPGFCVSSVDNSVVDCSVANSRYVPSFSIPDGATMSLPVPATSVIVKGLSGELRLKNLGASLPSSPCATMTLSTATTLPDATGTHDPTSPSDSKYLGTMPTVTAAPKVIDGVVQ